MNNAAPHVSEEQLLLLLDGELNAGDAARVREHLAACWQCRTSLEEMERSIAEFVRYRNSLYQRCFPSPKAPWCDLHQRMAALDAAPGSLSFGSRVRESVTAFFTSPRRWAPAMACLLIVALVTYHLDNAPSVRAAELLVKATAAADSRPKARRIQIRTRSQRIARVTGNGAKTPAPVALASAEKRQLEEMEALFASAHYDWNDPLSARAFSQWRAQLPSKQDTVTTVPGPQSPDDNCFEIRTATDSGAVAEASLKLRVSDLEPVESTLLFRNQERVEITTLPEAPALPSTAAVSVLPPTSSSVVPPPPAAPAVVPAAPTPGDELRVFAVLHRLGADLGEPIEIERRPEGVRVRGLGIDAGRQEQIRQELAGVPQVQLEFAAGEASADSAAATRSAGPALIHPEAARWQARLEQQLGGRTAVDQFAENVLDLADQASARVHALRRLADRFPAATEAALSDSDQATLRAIRVEHAGILTQRLAELQTRFAPALPALGLQPVPVPAAAAGSWQERARQLSALARTLDASLAILLGGAPSGPEPDLPRRVQNALLELSAHSRQLMHP